MKVKDPVELARLQLFEDERALDAAVRRREQLVAQMREAEARHGVLPAHWSRWLASADQLVAVCSRDVETGRRHLEAMSSALF